MTTPSIDVQVNGPVARIVLNRPERLNAFDAPMMESLRAALADVGRREGVRALVLTGAGRAFSAGLDLTGVPAGGAAVSALMRDLYNPVIEELHALSVPTVAAVNGVAAGGGVGLALACDLVVAARSATFIQVFGPQLALVPDLGSTWHLPRLVGAARARGLAMLGERLSAEQAAAWGLIWACVDDDILAAEADRLAQRLAQGPTAALTATRRVLDQALDHDLAGQLDLERITQTELIERPEFREGVRAFLEKRKPVFRDGPPEAA